MVAELELSHTLQELSDILVLDYIVETNSPTGGRITKVVSIGDLQINEVGMNAIRVLYNKLSSSSDNKLSAYYLVVNEGLVNEFRTDPLTFYPSRSKVLGVALEQDDRTPEEKFRLKLGYLATSIRFDLKVVQGFIRLICGSQYVNWRYLFESDNLLDNTVVECSIGMVLRKPCITLNTAYYNIVKKVVRGILDERNKHMLESRTLFEIPDIYFRLFNPVMLNRSGVLSYNIKHRKSNEYNSDRAIIDRLYSDYAVDLYKSYCIYHMLAESMVSNDRREPNVLLYNVGNVFTMTRAYRIIDGERKFDIFDLYNLYNFKSYGITEAPNTGGSNSNTMRMSDDCIAVHRSSLDMCKAFGFKRHYKFNSTIYLLLIGYFFNLHPLFKRSIKDYYINKTDTKAIIPLIPKYAGPVLLKESNLNDDNYELTINGLEAFLKLNARGFGVKRGSDIKEYNQAKEILGSCSLDLELK